MFSFTKIRKGHQTPNETPKDESRYNASDPVLDAALRLRDAWCRASVKQREIDDLVMPQVRDLMDAMTEVANARDTFLQLAAQEAPAIRRTDVPLFRLSDSHKSKIRRLLNRLERKGMDGLFLKMAAPGVGSVIDDEKKTHALTIERWCCRAFGALPRRVLEMDAKARIVR